MVVVHDSNIIPEIAWDESDKDFLWFVWDEVLHGSSLATSTWTIPAGWTSHSVQFNASVTDPQTGKVYNSANSIFLSTGGAASGIYQIKNNVVLADSREYSRTVTINIIDL